MKNLLHFSTPSCVYSQQPTLRTEKTKMSQLMWKPASEIMMTHRCRKDGKNRIKECQHAKLQLGVFLQRCAAYEVRAVGKGLDDSNQKPAATNSAASLPVRTLFCRVGGRPRKNDDIVFNHY